MVGEGEVRAAMEGGATSIILSTMSASASKDVPSGWKLVPDKYCEEVSVGKAD